MKMIGSVSFPETQDEAAKWEDVVVMHPLSRKVLAVAHTRIEGAWCAYIDAVAGESHRQEAAEVLRSGAKVREPIARLLFPYFDGIPYAP